MKFKLKNPKNWEKTELFCPICGIKEVWSENTYGGDFYLGENYTCLNCGMEGCLDSVHARTEENAKYSGVEPVE